MRILITGSRGWTDAVLVAQILTGYHHTYAGAGYSLTLVSGACPDGADAICEYVAGVTLGWSVERHPADWQRLGRRAGFARNEHMVRLGAQVCLAFIAACNSPRCSRQGPHPSHGATHTADLTEAAGITTWRFYAPPLSDPGSPGSVAATSTQST